MHSDATIVTPPLDGLTQTGQESPTSPTFFLSNVFTLRGTFDSKPGVTQRTTAPRVLNATGDITVLFGGPNNAISVPGVRQFSLVDLS